MINELTRLTKLSTKILTANPTYPILGMICISGGIARITNLDTTVTIPIDIAGNYAIPLKVLKKVLATKPANIEIETDGDKVVLGYDGKKVKFPNTDPEQFPIHPEDTFTPLGRWSRSIIENLQVQVGFISKDELKPSLMGVYVKQIDGLLEMCSTDGHKMCLREGFTADAGEFEGIISPEWLKLIDKKGTEAPFVEIGDKYLRVTTEGMKIYSHLVDEVYPDFRSVFPSDFGGLADINRTDLIGTIKEGLGFANKETKKGVFTFSPKDLRVFVEDIESCTEWENTVQLQEQCGDDAPVAYDLALLETVLKSLKSEIVEVQYSKRTQPREDRDFYNYGATIIKDKLPCGVDITALLMPIRI